MVIPDFTVRAQCFVHCTTGSSSRYLFTCLPHFVAGCELHFNGAFSARPLYPSRMTLNQITAQIGACLLETAEWDGIPCQRKSEPQVRQAIADFLKANPYPGEGFYRLAYDFFTEVGTVADQCGILDRWKRAKGNPIEPIHLYCELGEDGTVGVETLEENLLEGLQRDPADLRLLTVAYDRAHEQDNWARRLCYTLELSKHGKTASDFVIFGIECGRNAMPERAEAAFNEALRLDPKNVTALSGLAMTWFERMELGKAEVLFLKVLKAEPENDCATKTLAKIARLRKGEPWTKGVEARRKFWQRWQDTELSKWTDEQRRKRITDIMVKGRYVPA